MEIIIEITRILNFKKIFLARGKLIPAGETDFSGSRNHFFLQLLEAPASDIFFRLGKNYFSTKSFIPPCENEFYGYWKAFSFLQSFFPLVETVTEIRGSQFLKKQRILTNEN